MWVATAARLSPRPLRRIPVGSASPVAVCTEAGSPGHDDFARSWGYETGNHAQVDV